MLATPGSQDWLDRLPLAAGVVREGRFAYVNEALLQLVGQPREALIGKDLFLPIAPEDRVRVRERHARRIRGERVIDSYEFDVLRPDGTRRHVEIWITQLGEDTVFQLYDRTDAAMRQRKLLALARLGAAVQGEQSRHGVLARIDAAGSDSVLRLLLVRLYPEGTRLRIAGASAPRGMLEQVETILGENPIGTLAPWSETGQTAWHDGVAFIDDVPTEAARNCGSVGAAMREVTIREKFFRGVLLRIDECGEPSHLLMIATDWILPEDVPAMSLFGAQISAALTAARIIADTTARNAELTALNRVAGASGTQIELSALLARGSEALEQVLHCAAIAVYLVKHAEGLAILVHQHGGSEEAGKLYARVPLEGTRLGEVARSGRTLVLRPEDYPDPERRRVISRMGQQVLISVPLVARSEVVGIMNVAYAEPRKIEPREIEILQAAAAHFASGIEVSRLIDDLRRSYADLARAQERLVHRERLAALGELAAAVAHEVRNPLGVIFNSLGSLRRLVGDTGDARVLFDILSEEAQRLNAIVGDLLDFARPLKLTLQPVQLTEVVEEAVTAALGESEAKIRLEHDRSELPTVPLDLRLIRQAVLNVASNAVQSIEGEGTLRTSVTLGRDAQTGGECARIEIADSGTGIPEQVLPRIFEPFFTTRAKGTGLGLALVKRIVEAHRGHVSVRSAHGSGTTFVIELPLTQADEPVLEREPSIVA